MFDFNKMGSRIVAAAFSLAVTAGVLATAIYEASPTGAFA